MSPANLAKAEHSTPAGPHNCKPPSPRQPMIVAPAKAGTQRLRQSCARYRGQLPSGAPSGSPLDVALSVLPGRH
jgi:hypothetical protein